MRFPSLKRLLLTGGVLAALSRLPGILARRSAGTTQTQMEQTETSQPASAGNEGEVSGDGPEQLRVDGETARQRAADDGFGGSIDAAANATPTQVRGHADASVVS